MKIHGVSYEDLKNFGQTPQILCEQLNKSFENAEVLVADNELEQTEFLLKELFSVGKAQRKNFVLKPLYEFLLEKIQDRARLKTMEDKAKGKGPIINGVSKFFYLRNLTKSVMNEISFEKYEQILNFSFDDNRGFRRQLFKNANGNRHRIRSGLHGGE